MWYHDIVMEYFVANSFLECTLDVLVLRRSLPALVKSIYELGWFTRKVRPAAKQCYRLVVDSTWMIEISLPGQYAAHLRTESRTGTIG